MWILMNVLLLRIYCNVHIFYYNLFHWYLLRLSAFSFNLHCFIWRIYHLHFLWLIKRINLWIINKLRFNFELRYLCRWAWAPSLLLILFIVLSSFTFIWFLLWSTFVKLFLIYLKQPFCTRLNFTFINVISELFKT